jgi:hypothetical protein
VENLEQAIVHCERALTVYTLEAFPKERAMTQTNLAGVYSDRMNKVSLFAQSGLFAGYTKAQQRRRHFKHPLSTSGLMFWLRSVS